MPHGVTTTFCEVDFCVDGKLHFSTRRPDRQPIWFKCIYRQIAEDQTLVLEQHRSDERGNFQDSTDWPASIIELHLKEFGEKTELTVIHKGMASARATDDDYSQGWTETLERLTSILKAVG